jgi:hypothetical protein
MPEETLADPDAWLRARFAGSAKKDHDPDDVDDDGDRWVRQSYRKYLQLYRAVIDLERRLMQLEGGKHAGSEDSLLDGHERLKRGKGPCPPPPPFP